MLKLAQTKQELNIIQDQVGAPTGAALIADVTTQVLNYYFLQPCEHRRVLHGHYHLVAQGETTWFDYARYIFAQAQHHGTHLMIEAVHPIQSKDYPTAAKRPLNSRLNTQKLQSTFNIHLPHWQHGVDQVIQEIL